jgi:hypothetical protein
MHLGWIGDPDRYEVRVWVTASQTAHLAIGQRVTIVAASVDQPVPGQVIEIAQDDQTQRSAGTLKTTADQHSARYQVRIGVDERSPITVPMLSSATVAIHARPAALLTRLSRWVGTTFVTGE